jgi:energy-coupling factor transport system substrate-specific component
VRSALKGGRWLLIPLLALFALAIYGLMYPDSALGFLGNWLILLVLVVVGILGAFVLEFESANIGAKEVSLIAVLSSVASVSRIPFAGFLSFQPCTFIIICTGYVFGPVAGFMTGATTALVSNIFIGQGPWTPFQMLCWGLVGASSAILGRYKVGMTGLMVWGIAWGFIYGWLMNVWFWVLFVFPLNLDTWIATVIMSFVYDLSHSIANVVFFGLFGSQMLTVLTRYKKRFHVEFGRSKKVEDARSCIPPPITSQPESSA